MLVLDLPYVAFPPWVVSCPLPLVGLAGDSSLLWHGYRRLDAFDVLLADRPGVERFHRQGLKQARPAMLYGVETEFLDDVNLDAPRDIDVLFIANMHPAVQRPRLPWLARLARLARNRRVLIHSGAWGIEYRTLLRRSRIVFNRSARGECNRRVFEAAVSGAMLVTDGNAETAEHLRDGVECVFYRDDNLEALLEQYLDHEDQRRHLAEAAFSRRQSFSFEALLRPALDALQVELPILAERARKRAAERRTLSLPVRAQLALTASVNTDASLPADLEAALDGEPVEAGIHHALGAVAGLAARDGVPGAAQRAARMFRDASARDGRHLPSLHHLVEALVIIQNHELAIEGARGLLDTLGRGEGIASLADDSGRFPPGFEHFQVEWDRAAWDHAGDAAAEIEAKRKLLCWRLHLLLAELTGESPHFHEAVLARPDLPPSRGALGCALGRAGQSGLAVPHLAEAVAANPLDASAARALYQTLLDSGKTEQAEHLVEERRLLQRAAPGLVVVEKWFAAVPSSPKAGLKLRPTVVWEGGISGLHSLALVNRELCRRLAARDLELSILPAEFPPSMGVAELPLPDILTDRFHRALSRPADVTVRHRWPIDFRPPAEGHFVVMQPWEFGSVPIAWVEALSQLADEVWTPTHYVRDCFVAGGVPADRVAVVPLGVDVSIYRPDALPLPLKTTRRFKFLFVGGTIKRKGIDVLLAAYRKAFSAADEVCLVIKDMGNGSFYRDQTAEKEIAAFRADPGAPDIEYLSADLSFEEMAGLYTACDALVQPYRGEGFGLPIAEAMACGKPVIITGMGAALDFCNDRTAYLIPARRDPFAERNIGGIETAGRPWWAEPDGEALVELLRQVMTNPEEAKALGAAACEHVRRHWTWDHAAAVVEERLRALRRRPIVRFDIRPLPSTNGVHRQAEQTATRRMRISLTMIVRDEEHNIGECLACIYDLVDEIILVDTGSVDRTKQIARGFGPKVKIVDFPWIDDFSAARNKALAHATGDFILWLDADDRLNGENREKLRQLFARLPNENVACSLKCLCLAGGSATGPTVVDHVRIFRNLPDIRWRYRVHEQILGSVRENGGEVLWEDVVILHTGYQDAALRGRKLQRDLRLLRKAVAEAPRDPFILFNLGMVHHELGENEHALSFLQDSLRHSNPHDSIVRKLYALIAGCHLGLGRRQQALKVFNDGLNLYPDDAELLYRHARLLRDMGEAAQAEANLVRLLSSRPANHFASTDPTLRGWRGRHELATLLLDQGRHAEAQAQWRQVVREVPDLLAAWHGLAEAAIALGDGAELEQAAAQIERLDGAPQAAALRARLPARGASHKS
jgi:glycosyltransferase involved in cell wall biosynthesis